MLQLDIAAFTITRTAIPGRRFYISFILPIISRPYQLTGHIDALRSEWPYYERIIRTGELQYLWF